MSVNNKGITTVIIVLIVLIAVSLLLVGHFMFGFLQPEGTPIPGPALNASMLRASGNVFSMANNGTTFYILNISTCEGNCPPVHCTMISQNHPGVCGRPGPLVLQDLSNPQSYLNKNVTVTGTFVEEIVPGTSVGGVTTIAGIVHVISIELA